MTEGFWLIMTDMTNMTDVMDMVYDLKLLADYDWYD